jgi:hypothetical protein
MLRAIAAKNGFDTAPFLIGVAAQTPELLVMWQCSAGDRHKPKRLQLAGAHSVELKAIVKASAQSLKVVQTVVTLMGICGHYVSNLVVRERSEEPSTHHQYEDMLERVCLWGTDRFVAYCEDAKLKKANGVVIGQLEKDVLTSRASLLEAVKLRQDAADVVFFMGSARQVQECPVAFADGVTDYGRNCVTTRWCNLSKTFIKGTISEWQGDEGGDEHLKSALVLLGEGQLGKTKLGHMMAQEFCVGYKRCRYVDTSSVDQLGILSHCGDIRKSGCLLLNDIEFRAARGKNLGPEALKAILAPFETRSIQDTRYRPAVLVKDLPRILALNGKTSDMGAWFRTYGQADLGVVVDYLAAGKVKEATAHMMNVDADVSAICRRATFAFCVADLVKSNVKSALADDSKARSTTAPETKRQQRGGAG